MSYINVAFRSSREYEVYFFMKNKYVRVYYTPRRTDDKILTNLRLISSGFPSLAATFFAEPGMDCSFDTEVSEAYVFSTKFCAYIDYAPGTIFESGIDACFASHEESEAYLFKGDQYVRIKFTPGTTDDVLLGNVRPILDGWPCLRGILPLS
ncbi:hypothetical protein VNO80_06608 [Phaseolus coccineus]|uniref:Uncharacterized protein n=1 Tax=Phaseolus coccineus TaxID=3886 RepID=A0AAN9NMI3_PHACN